MEWPVLVGVPDDDRARVLASARRRRFNRGEIVFHDGDLGDTLYLVAKGHFAVRITTPFGDTVTFAVLGRGDVFGELALVSEENRRGATVLALEASETLGIRRDTFEELCRDHPSVQRFIVQLLAAQSASMSARVVEALYVPADQRVLRRLVDLCDSYDTGTGDTVTIPLTQDEIASLAGTTRVTANRVLREAEINGLLTLGRGRVAVTDRAGIVERAT